MPHHDLLEAELRNLECRNGRVNHPTRGPIQTSDVGDALMNVCDYLLSDLNGYQIHKALDATTISGSAPPRHPLADAFDGVHAGPPPGLTRGNFGHAARGGRMRGGRP